MVYFGIGSRKTPPKYLAIMEKIGEYMAKEGHVLRSGGAKGADSAFEAGCDKCRGAKDIFLPERFFNRNTSPLYCVSEQAISMAKRFHPAPERLDYYDEKLMGRNSYQVMGQDLASPADFGVCWTLDGFNGYRGTRSLRSGGTGQAISIAQHFGIPVYNIGWNEDLVALRKFLKEHKNGSNTRVSG